MEDNIHPVVRLIAKRMESHPEEFKFHNTGSLAITGRWETWINQLGWYFNEAEKELIYGKAKELIFQRVHEEVMDELLNGEDRRAKEKQEYELERHKMAALHQQAQAYAQQHRAYLQQSQSAYLGSNQYANHVAPANLRLGSETIDEGMIKQIKRKLGL